MRVLFVDDDESVCDLLSVFCTSLGIEFRAVSSAKAALTAFQEEPYALVVTDLQMPEMDGVNLAKQLRQHYPQVGLYAFTGESSVYPIREIERIFDKVFFKPTDYSRMIADSMKFLAVKKYPFLA